MRKQNDCALLCVCRKSLLLAQLFVALLISAYAGVALAESADVADTVEYYYENYCSSCRPEDTFREEYKLLTGKALDQYTYAFYNIKETAGFAKFNDTLTRLNIDERDAALPLLIVGDEIFMGQSQISERLPAYALSYANSTVSRIYYLYLTACESCVEVSHILDELPASVIVHRGKYSFDSDIELIKVNINDDAHMAMSLFDAFGVPEEKRLAPILMAGETYYQGMAQIDLFTRAFLYQAAAVGTPIISAVNETPETRWWEATIAGLVGGFNPCALSMLLLFLAIVSSARAGRLVFAYLIGKFTAYLLIGALMYSLFQAWNPTWMPTAAKYTLTALVAVVIIMNVWDAIQASRERYGAIRNQLPGRLRGRLARWIQQSMEQAGMSSPMIWVAAGLGALVAAGEFLCAGQVYLAVILAAVQAGQHAASDFGKLLAYCIAFMLPSIALSLLAMRGYSILRISERLRKHLPAVKLATAALLALMAATAWIL